MSGESSDLVVAIRRAVHPGLTLDVDFRLGSEAGVLFGASGAGKTTLLRMIAGLEWPDLGTIRLGPTCFASGRRGPPTRLRRVGFIFQDDRLFPHLDVAGNLRFGLTRWNRSEAEARVAEVSRLCGVEAILHRRPETLSGGERQRVGLARAIAPRPRLLLCDEPVSALDLGARHALIRRIREVQEAESIPVLSVTHSPEEAQALGSRMFRLEAGRIVAEGDPLDVLRPGLGPMANVFPAQATSAESVRIEGGPSLVVSGTPRPVGSRVLVRVRSDDIVLALGPVGVLSARNLVDGEVERVDRPDQGLDATVIVRVDRSRWVVGVTAATIPALGLIAGARVRMIFKARSCQVFDRDAP